MFNREPKVKRPATPKKETPPTKKRRTDGAGQTPPTPTAKAKGKAAANKAIDDSEQVCLKCQQYFSNCQDPKVLITLTVKGHDALNSSVNKRLSPELTQLYTTNYAPSGEILTAEPAADSRGMKVFTELREHQHRLHVLKTFIATLQATDGHEASAEALRNEYVAATAADIRISDFVQQMVTSRAVEHLGRNTVVLIAARMFGPRTACASVRVLSLPLHRHCLLAMIELW